MGIVISPLISLMRDQIEALNKKGIRARTLNSMQSFEEKRSIFQQIKENQIDVLYLSPERFLADDIQAIIKSHTISVLAIDEAHTVSQWGKDFRNAYLDMATIVKSINHIPKIALTATVNEQTKNDIILRLGMEFCNVFENSFERSNIHIKIIEKDKDWVNQATKIIKEKQHQNGIVFFSSKKKVDEFYQHLVDNNINAIKYHAGMEKSDRENSQKIFENSDSIVAVATIAFGMGIDKSNVRYVLHCDAPTSFDNYYQEIGRAGRDGAPAEAIMLYKYGDLAKKKSLILRDNPVSEQDTHNLINIEKIIDFAETNTCRTKLLLKHFDEIKSTDCGHCDNCTNPPHLSESYDVSCIAINTCLSTGQNLARHIYVTS